jgi:phosphatidylglycerophosphatase C
LTVLAAALPPARGSGENPWTLRSAHLPPSTPPPRVAVFDLDGTITYRDTLVPFLLHVLRRRPLRVLRLWPLPWALARYAVRQDRGVLKQSLIRYVLGGLGRAEIAAHVERFLDALWPSGLRPGALEAIERHRVAGDRLVLLSASPDLYVPRIGTRLGFADVVCTGVQWDEERLHGDLTTANRHGPEKRRCVEELRARHPAARFVAYANAASDLAHLEIVDAPCLVNANAAARRQAAALGIRCDEWH